MLYCATMNSKTLAEMGVTNFTSRPECRFKAASILPCVVLGPPLGSRLSFSHKFLLGFLNKQIRGTVVLFSVCVCFLL